jgi:hypothetical protein
MKLISSIKRLKRIGIISLSISFLSLILLLNTEILPHRVFGISVSSMSDVAEYLIFAGVIVASYCFFKYDYSLHELDLKGEDIEGDNKNEFEASPSKLKRDRAKNARNKRRKSK